jgi:hypothetical protein
VRVCDLDQKVWQVSLLISTRLEKIQNKQATFIVVVSCMNEHVFDYGKNLSPLGTSSKRVLAFCKTKLQVAFTIPHIG